MQNCSGGIWLAGSSAGLRVLWGLSWLMAANKNQATDAMSQFVVGVPSG